MLRILPSRLVAIAALLLASPVAAQTPGPPPSVQPSPDQPAPEPPVAAPTALPSLVGTWSGFGRAPATENPQADAFDANGTFVSVSRLSASVGLLPAGFMLRVWGTYRTTPDGLDRLRVEFRVQGWSPRQLCNQGGYPAPKCRPFDPPVTLDTVLVTFPSPDRLQSVSEAHPDFTTVETRDDHPALLQVAVPERWNYCSPEAPGACGSDRLHYTDAPRCDDLQQQRICIINDGHLVRSPNGCLRCVAD